MDVNFEQLIKKILDFWKKFDEKEFTVKELREIFNHYELAIILFDQDFFYKYHRIIRIFKEKLYMIDNLFTEEEEMFFKNNKGVLIYEQKRRKK